MKILFIKEIIDELGHYNSYNFKNVDFNYILDSFLTKANGVHTILTFNTDTVILNKKPEYPYKIKILENEKSRIFILNNTKKYCTIQDISFNNYDIIWYRDDILNISELKKIYPRVLFVYENVEHSFSKFNFDYDLILDHTDFSFKKIIKLNTTVSFPYVINKKVLRNNINCIDKKLDIYMDSRDIYKWAGGVDQNIYLITQFYLLKVKYFNDNNLKIISNIPRPEIH